MKKLEKELTLINSALHSRKGRSFVMALTIALFVISASAPNATIGIGK